MTTEFCHRHARALSTVDRETAPTQVTPELDHNRVTVRHVDSGLGA